MYDVIVIGAGPSGSYVASRLAQLGHGVIVLDKKREAGNHTCCTGIISVECFDAFNLDATIFRQASSAKFFSPSGQFITLKRESPQACIVDRPSLDRSLKEHARRNGAEYLFSAPVVAVIPEPDCVSVTVDYQGEQRTLTAKAVVLACGFGSKFPERLGLGKINDFVFGAQAAVNTINIDEVEVYFDQNLFPGFFGWLVPTSDNKGLAGLLVQETPSSYLNNLLSHLQSQYKITSFEDISFGTIPLGTLARTYSDRTVVIGDAAGQVKPTTGGGIYYGLLCADIAAECLHQAFLADDFSAARLSAYDKQWRAKLGSELQTGYLAHRLYQKLSNHCIDRLFRAARDKGIPGLVAESEDFSFDWHRPLILKLAQKLAFSLPARLINAF
jgi:geranylgeranyl reductase family protein